MDLLFKPAFLDRILLSYWYLKQHSPLPSLLTQVNALVAEWELIPAARLQTLAGNPSQKSGGCWCRKATSNNHVCVNVEVSTYFWPCSVARSLFYTLILSYSESTLSFPPSLSFSHVISFPSSSSSSSSSLHYLLICSLSLSLSSL